MTETVETPVEYRVRWTLPLARSELRAIFSDKQGADDFAERLRADDVWAREGWARVEVWSWGPMMGELPT